MKKKILAFLLAAIMLVSLLPVAALAAVATPIEAVDLTGLDLVTLSAKESGFIPCNGEPAIPGTTPPETNPVWGDYVFDGWYDARTGGNKVESGFEEDKAYYAHWKVSKSNSNYVLTETLTVGSDGLYAGENSTPSDLSAYGLGFTPASVDPAKLTMTNAVIDTCNPTQRTPSGLPTLVSLYSDASLAIELNGENTVRTGDVTCAEPSLLASIFVGGGLKITGGSLTVDAGIAKSEEALVSIGSFTLGALTSDATLSVAIDNTADMGAAFAIMDNFTVTGGSVMAYGPIYDLDFGGSGVIFAEGANVTGYNNMEGKPFVSGVTCKLMQSSTAPIVISFVPLFDLCNGTVLAGADATSAPAVTPTWGSYKFVGWYDQRTYGSKVESGFAVGNTYYAHWQVSESNTNLVLTEGLTVLDFSNISKYATIAAAAGKDGFYIGNRQNEIMEAIDEAEQAGGTTPLGPDDLSAYGLSFTASTPSDPMVLTMNNAVIDTYDGIASDISTMGAVVLYGHASVTLVGDNVIHIGTKKASLNTLLGLYAMDITLNGDNLTVETGDVCFGEFNDTSSWAFQAMHIINNAALLTVKSGDVIGSEEGKSLSISALSLTNKADKEINVSVGSSSCSTGVQIDGEGLDPTDGVIDNAGTLVIEIDEVPTRYEEDRFGDLEPVGGMSAGVSGGRMNNSGTCRITVGDAYGGSGVNLPKNGDGSAVLDNSGTMTITIGDGEFSVGVEAESVTNSGVLSITTGDGETSMGVEAESVTNSGVLSITVGEAAMDEELGEPLAYTIRSEQALTVTGGSVISYGTIWTDSVDDDSNTDGIVAEGACVTGYDNKGGTVEFVSGTTKKLTQETKEVPVVIAFAAMFDPCNGDAILLGADATSAPANDPIWKDHTFNGWYDAKTGGSKVDSGYSAGTIYYGQWVENPEETPTASECEFEQSEKLTEGKLKLKLGGDKKGEFTFTKNGSGWSIQNSENKYLAMQDGKLILSDTAFAWTYKNGAFSVSTSAKTTQKTGGRWFGFIYIPGSSKTVTVTTTYYLSTVTDGAKLSTNSVEAELYVEASGDHVWGAWTDCKDGENHKRVCKNCGETETEAHSYGESHKCVCGAYDPEESSVTISASVKEKTEKQYVGFWPFGYYKNVKTYTATIKTEATGTKVTKVQYQLNGGKWTTGTSVSSDKPINSLKVRVTDSNGKVYDYTYGR